MIIIMTTAIRIIVMHVIKQKKVPRHWAWRQASDLMSWMALGLQPPSVSSARGMKEMPDVRHH